MKVRITDIAHLKNALFQTFKTSRLIDSQLRIAAGKDGSMK